MIIFPSIHQVMMIRLTRSLESEYYLRVAKINFLVTRFLCMFVRIVRFSGNDEKTLGRVAG